MALPATQNSNPFAGGPYVMGVVNVTPDSFSDGGHFLNPDKAIEHGLKLLEEGADILDIGGESSRPGAQPVTVEEEISRITPVIEALAPKARWVSVDTRNAATMEAAIKAGANIINDISALSHDPKSAALVGEAKLPVVLMHMQGTPETMQKNPSYNNVVEDILGYFRGRISFCETHRIDPNMVVLDPGIGFGKTLEDNLLILRNINKFRELSAPLALGVSRKSFIGKIANDIPADQRIPGSISAALWALSQGVEIFRVHDVKETIQAFKIYSAISEAGS